HGDGPWELVRRRFEELAAEVGAGHDHVGVEQDADKVTALVALGGVPEELEPVSWEEHETYAQALAAMEGRVFSWQWRLPDEVWWTAVTRLRAELQDTAGDLDAPHPSRHSFRLTAVRF
ncbi:MAG TPA: hypothetical protein VGA45_19185, partial [Actinomycetota bacterium]